MEFLGGIEEDYECAGYCTASNTRQLFSDCTKTVNEPCYEHIAGPVMLKLFGNAGIIFLVTGIILMIAWCVHYGLCCRKEKGPDYDTDYKDANYDNYNFEFKDAG